jgi:hypothetical protein
VRVEAAAVGRVQSHIVCHMCDRARVAPRAHSSSTKRPEKTLMRVDQLVREEGLRHVKRSG